MTIKPILVTYASVSGSTGEVAEAIAEVIRADDALVAVHPLRNVESLTPYRAAVVGSSIRMGRWLPEAFSFLERHASVLRTMPVAYFTTCLTMLKDTTESRQIVTAYMQPVLDVIPDLTPVGLGLFAGALDPTRLALSMLRDDLAPQGDYRDWESIRAWAAEIRPALLARSSPDAVMLRGAILSYTDMSGTDLRYGNLHGVALEAAQLQLTDLRGADLGQAQLSRANLTEADLAKAGLNWAELSQATLDGANLEQVNLIGANLSQASLETTNLQHALLNGADLSHTNLSRANLCHADLNWANLRGANLSRADLREANLGWANLREANLHQADLTGALYNTATEWPDNFSPQQQGCMLVQGH